MSITILIDIVVNCGKLGVPPPPTLLSAEELFASSDLNQTSLRKEYSVLENYYLRINSNKYCLFYKGLKQNSIDNKNL